MNNGETLALKRKARLLAKSPLAKRLKTTLLSSNKLNTTNTVLLTVGTNCYIYMCIVL